MSSRSLPAMNLRWHNPTNGRRYQVVLGLDLFGDSVLRRGWCGADGKRGGEKQDVFTWEADALSALRRVIRRRERRGYVLLPPFFQLNRGATQEERQAITGIHQVAKPLIQVSPGDALGKVT